MSNLRAQILIGALCLLLGILVVTQFRTHRLSKEEVPVSPTDQATYISQLYESNTELRRQVQELARERIDYEADTSSGQSNLDSLVRDLQDLRMANGEVPVIGPGVTVLVDGDLALFELQDLVNELRNASAEALAVNGMRIVARSAIASDDSGRITVDHWPLSRPYRLQAIGDPDILVPALERKGGLIALLETGNSSLQIKVTRHAVDDKVAWLELAKTALDFNWEYAQPVP